MLEVRRLGLEIEGGMTLYYCKFNCPRLEALRVSLSQPPTTLLHSGSGARWVDCTVGGLGRLGSVANLSLLLVARVFPS